MTQLKRYVIEREIPGLGEMSPTEVCAVARSSNNALDQIGAEIQWVHSYLSDNKSFCVYLAADEAKIMEHSEKSGIPVASITEIQEIIDPLTANR